MNIKFIILATLLTVFFLTSSCGKGFFKKVDTRQVPISGPERAKKNVKEGRGVSLGSIIGKDGREQIMSLVLQILCGELH